MYKGKFLIAGVVISAALLGCSKKEEPVQETTPAPAVSESFQTDAKDVFDEFYEDEQEPVSESKEKSSTSTAPSVSFTENGRYVVQVATVNSRSAADKLSSDLNNMGYPAYVAEVENPSPNLYGTYYRVRVGGFTGVSVARSFGENTLDPEGYDYWVDNKANDNVGISGSDFGSGSAQSSWETPSTSSSQQDSWDSEPEQTTQQQDSWDSEPEQTTQQQDSWESEPEQTTQQQDSWESEPEQTTQQQDSWESEPEQTTQQQDSWESEPEQTTPQDDSPAPNTTTVSEPMEEKTPPATQQQEQSPEENTPPAQQEAESTEEELDDGWGTDDWGSGW